MDKDKKMKGLYNIDERYKPEYLSFYKRADFKPKIIPGINGEIINSDISIES